MVQPPQFDREEEPRATIKAVGVAIKRSSPEDPKLECSRGSDSTAQTAARCSPAD